MLTRASNPRACPLGPGKNIRCGRSSSATRPRGRPLTRQLCTIQGQTPSLKLLDRDGFAAVRPDSDLCRTPRHPKAVILKEARVAHLTSRDAISQMPAHFCHMILTKNTSLNIQKKGAKLASSPVKSSATKHSARDALWALPTLLDKAAYSRLLKSTIRNCTTRHTANTRRASEEICPANRYYMPFP